MRNACRKEESRGGIRQCANMLCAKWETFPREFAKCRRCRKAKYCGVECRSRVWSEGRRFWCSAREGEDNLDWPTMTTNTTASSHTGHSRHTHQQQVAVKMSSSRTYNNNNNNNKTQPPPLPLPPTLTTMRETDIQMQRSPVASTDGRNGNTRISFLRSEQVRHQVPGEGFKGVASGAWPLWYQRDTSGRPDQPALGWVEESCRLLAARWNILTSCFSMNP